MQVDELLRRLEKVKKTGGGYVARCPGHEDQSPSLSVREADGKILLNCFAGCSIERICGGLGIEVKELFEDDGRFDEGVTLEQLAARAKLDPEDLKRHGIKTVYNRNGKAVVTIPYRDIDGTDQRRKVRLRVEGKGKYEWWDKERPEPSVYGAWRLPEFRQRGAIVLTEGETDTLALWACGIPAIGIPGAKWVEKVEARHFDGITKAWICHDNDEAGIGMSNLLMDRIKNIAPQVDVRFFSPPIEISGKPIKDVCDWRAASNGSFYEEFRESCRGARHEPDEEKLWTIPELLRTTFPERRWLVKNLLCEGLGICFSPAKVGKSFLIGACTVAVANGKTFLGNECNGSGVLYLDLEQDAALAKERWESILGRKQLPERLRTMFRWPRMDVGGLEKLDMYLTKHSDTKLVVIDVLAEFWPSAMPRGVNAYMAEYRVLGALRQLCRKHGASVMMVHHSNRSTPKDPLDKASGTNAMTGVPDVVWVLSRQRNGEQGNLFVTGKAVKDNDVEMMFDGGAGGWTTIGGYYGYEQQKEEAGEELPIE